MYKIPHGDACSIFLPGSMELNLDYAESRYANVAKALGVSKAGCTDRENALNAIRRVREIRREINAPVSPLRTLKLIVLQASETLTIRRERTGSRS